ncbi:MAG: 30S ribosomal protein S8 [Kiritimatiellae bacterium]|jgi:small subunit ribosomal protein S8|nr:30S ribosomal protein S8 [Kiritimatiellia bacterium]MBR4190981.1 30S ribosomal protein S8 [Kiritimatiellia bacterium]MBR4251123.1 30S ribosomal protein S8 [Kiritimatiellia bacterium]MBR4252839.1 30S ribosomal protein S8 [Kiritimatiellia bacterium]
MSCSDPIADMLTRIRNASKAGLPAVEMGHSRLKAEIARILKKEGYIADSADFDDDGKKGLRITLKYDYNDKPIIQQLRRVSKPGLRRYVAAGDIPRVRGGIGTAVLSTSRGVMSDREARAAHVGGEVLCHVW